MSALEHEWPDEDRRHDALINALCDVYSFEESPLSRTQTRILEALSRGLGAEGSADVLGYSPETIKSESQLARRKLGAKNTTHACCEALRAGIIR